LLRYCGMVLSKRNSHLANLSAEKKKADDKKREDNKRKEEEENNRKEEEERVKKRKCDLFGVRDEIENGNVSIVSGGVPTTSSVVVSKKGSKLRGDNDLHISNTTLRGAYGNFAVPFPRPVVNSQQSIARYLKPCVLTRNHGNGRFS
jgi:hypothetical protein